MNTYLVVVVEKQKTKGITTFRYYKLRLLKKSKNKRDGNISFQIEIVEKKGLATFHYKLRLLSEGTTVQLANMLPGNIGKLSLLERLQRIQTGACRPFLQALRQCESCVFIDYNSFAKITCNADMFDIILVVTN